MSALMPTVTSHQLIVTVILIVVGLNLIANMRAVSRCGSVEGPPVPQSVSVLIPARNEAHNIRRCLDSLLAQDFPILEVLVLDDNSTDDTARVVGEYAEKDARVRLVSGQLLPQGWMGKNYACHQLGCLAQGEWLLFTDADTDHQPGSLRWAVAAAQQNQADLVSLIPHTVTHTLGERLILPIIPFGMLGFFPFSLGAWLRIPFMTIAIGTFMLFRRKAYESIEGHSGVMGEVAEDVVLARQVMRAGGRVVLLDGSDQLDVHFYRGFSQSWHGIAKSAFAALDYRLLPSFLMIGFYGFIFLWPLVFLATQLWEGNWGGPAVRLAAFQALLNSGLYYAVAVRFRLPRSTAIFYPVTVVLVILILLDSMRRAFFSGIPWKERLYRMQDGVLRH